MDDGDGVFVGDEDAAFPAVFDTDAEVVHAGGSSEADLPVAADVVNGGLPRHIVVGGTLRSARTDPAVREHALATGGAAAQLIAQRVAKQDPIALNAFAAVWDQIEIKPLPHSGTAAEQAAMRFHAGGLAADGLTPRQASLPHARWWPQGSGYATEFAARVSGQGARNDAEATFFVNGRLISGARPIDDFASVIDAELQKGS